MSELKPCPFCGGEAEIISRPVYTYLKPYDPETAEKKHYVQCKDCATQCGALEYDTPEAAAEAWNRRAQPANEPLTLEQMREMDGELVWLDGICWGIRFFGWTVLHGDKFDWHGESYPIKGFMPSFYGNESGFHRGNKAYRHRPERSADGQA